MDVEMSEWVMGVVMMIVMTLITIVRYVLPYFRPDTIIRRFILAVYSKYDSNTPSPCAEMRVLVSLFPNTLSDYEINMIRTQVNWHKNVI